ncbi:MAG: ABC transporter ATP-binding protein [Bacteroidia bacterium]|nr:ABC transporter ATP-binding protein [Bacteroidia bacterium]
MDNSVLEIKNLEISFETDGVVFKAVDSIDFVLNKGETLGIVGESGSGKSVTSLAIMGLLQIPPAKITNGEILFYEEGKSPVNFLKLAEKQMRAYSGNKISMIFQEPMTSLNPVYKCGEQVTEIIRLHQKKNNREAKKLTIELFNEVQLPRPEAIFDSYPFQLSGGQKQRVMIAMAISCKPVILIADEPTTALDVTVQKTILELLRDLQKKYSMSIIFISHDLGVMAELCSRVLVMYKGKIVEQGFVKEVLTDPKHPYTKGLLECRPSLGARPKRLSVISDFFENADENNYIQVEKNPYTIFITNSERAEKHKEIYSREPILQIKNLKNYFPVKRNFFGKPKNFVKAVDDVSFDVYKGETVGLVGESGCGKTTLGRTIIQLIEATEGSIIYKGKNLLALSKPEVRKLRKNVQIIFQDPYSSLNPRLTIGDAITEPMKVHGIGKSDKERKQIAVELLKKVNLEEEHYHRYPHEFSGGQRQRIGIARALAVEPEFIICDESVSALDVSVQAQALNLLNSLKDEFDLTYIFISHDLAVVKYMSDRMIVMNMGKIEEMGEADIIYADPKTDYTRRLIEAIPKII